jgi:hypothetical protein
MAAKLPVIIAWWLVQNSIARTSRCMFTRHTPAGYWPAKAVQALFGIAGDSPHWSVPLPVVLHIW